VIDITFIKLQYRNWRLWSQRPFVAGPTLAAGEGHEGGFGRRTSDRGVDLGSENASHQKVPRLTHHVDRSENGAPERMKIRTVFSLNSLVDFHGFRLS
jgi:hypothetical protein